MTEMLAQVFGLLCGQLVEEEAEDVELLVGRVVAPPLSHLDAVGLLEQEVLLLVVHHYYVLQLPSQPAQVLHVPVLQPRSMVPVQFVRDEGQLRDDLL